jgi:hypothetical protein
MKTETVKPETAETQNGNAAPTWLQQPRPGCSTGLAGAVPRGDDHVVLFIMFPMIYALLLASQTPSQYYNLQLLPGSS